MTNLSMKAKRERYVAFTEELFYETWFRKYNPLRAELKKIKSEIKKQGTYETAHFRELKARAAEIEELVRIKKDLDRQFRPSYHCLVDGEMKVVPSKAAARRITGLPDDEEGFIVGGSPRSSIEGCATHTATDRQIGAASTVGADGTLYLVCCSCGEELPYDAFGVHKSSVSGRQSKCRACAYVYGREYYEKKKKETAAEEDAGT